MSNVTALKKETSPHAEAHGLRQTIAKLAGELVAAEHTIVNAEGEAKHLALRVLLGKATAADQEKHRRDVVLAREALADKHAVLAAAKEELKRLEWLEGAEKREKAAAEAKLLIAERIEAAKRFDRAAREMQEAFVTFHRLGHEIPNTGVELKIAAGSMAMWESLRGLARVDAALPALVEQLHPNVIRSGSRASLAASEAALWNGLM